MIAGLSTPVFAGLAFIGVVVITGAAYWVYSRRIVQSKAKDDTGPMADVPGAAEGVVPDGGHAVTLQQPQITNTTLPVRLWKLYRHHKKKQKIGKKGYVQWYLIDDTLPEPTFIRPDREGGGVPEYEHDGDTYLFPREAMMPDEQTGMLTAVHKRGDAMPINLETPGKPAIGADKLKEFLDLRVSSSPPSLLDNIDLSPQKIMYGLIVAIIVFAVVSEVMA